MSVLSLERLTVRFDTEAGSVHAVEEVSLAIEEGEILGLVGESGSGKSVTASAIMGMLAPPGRIHAGRIDFAGEDLRCLPHAAMRRLRGHRLAMILQDPSAALNPVLRIGEHFMESIRAHRAVGRAAARAEACDALARVGIAAPEERLAAYPHQVSGGMRQRVCIALALLHRPALVIADEPTTALDVTIQAHILGQVRMLAQETGTAWLWITHDLSVVAGLADRIAVMYAGRIVEQGPADRVLDQPAHPYTQGLIAALPAGQPPGTRLRAIPGAPPSLRANRAGCSFAPRCERADGACRTTPPLHDLGADRGWVRCRHPLIGPGVGR